MILWWIDDTRMTTRTQSTRRNRKNKTTTSRISTHSKWGKQRCNTSSTWSSCCCWRFCAAFGLSETVSGATGAPSRTVRTSGRTWVAKAQSCLPCGIPWPSKLAIRTTPTLSTWEFSAAGKPQAAKSESALFWVQFTLLSLPTALSSMKTKRFATG